jgi:hypothetical protein
MDHVELARMAELNAKSGRPRKPATPIKSESLKRAASGAQDKPRS